MKRVAIFGKPGSGKSTLSKALARATGLPLHPLDSMVYQKDGQLVDKAVFNQLHEQVLNSERWIMDGLGPLGAFNQRLDVADTLIYIDLPYFVSYWLVTKRLLKGAFVKPEGWPDGSSVITGSLQSYKMLRLSRRFWNQEFMQRLEASANNKSIYIIRSISELNGLIKQHGLNEKKASK
ncbi:adenylate kinase [Vibrio tapetis]|uniref:Adenylate kinase n=1 Tax=Vibrio tapetis subsp. tapetis TaxID=1671868 RepID=A0A2N8ZB78_9VIBR|nr:adenylate kinase [Vibrio tapetis]SON49166.1 conserved protein of unknown function [Vibrio tapetis subsp. tapetis]